MSAKAAAWDRRRPVLVLVQVPARAGAPFSQSVVNVDVVAACEFVAQRVRLFVVFVLFRVAAQRDELVDLVYNVVREAAGVICGALVVVLEDDVVVDRGDMAAAAYVLLQGLRAALKPRGR